MTTRQLSFAACSRLALHALPIVLASSAASAQAPAKQDAPAPTPIPETIVLGTLEREGVPKVPLDATGSRDVLGPEEVESIGARDLNDLLQYLPAVSTRPYNGGESSAPSFSIRGLPDDGLTEYLHVAIDGVAASPLPYGWTAFSFFPLLTEQVYAIDLIRGGYAVRYSPNTVGGVLNLLTPPIPKEESYDVRATVGSYGYQSTLFSAGDDDGRFGYLLTLGERHGDGFRADSDFEYTTADLKTRWALGERDWLSLHASYIENEHRPPGGLTVAEYDQDRFANTRPENVFRGFRALADVVRHVDTGGGSFEWFGSFSQTRRNLTAERPAFGAPTELRVVDDDAYSLAAGFRAEDRFEAFGLEHELYWGVRVNEELLPNRTTDRTTYATGVSALIQDAEYELTTVGAHIDDTLHLTDAWTLVAGVRAEWIPVAQGEDAVVGGDFDETFFDVLPGISTSYEVAEWAALFANWQRSFRAPQVWGFGVSPTSPDQSLEFERGESIEAGVRFDAAGGLEGSIAVWNTEFGEIGFFDTNSVYRNIGEIEASGVDYVVRWNAGEAVDALDGFSLYGTLTTQDSEIVDAANPTNDGNETPYAWEEKLAWSIQYETSSRWRFSLGGTYVGESFSDDANTVAESSNGDIGLNPSRTVWDAQVSKDLSLGKKAAGRFFVGATNLFDSEWFVHSRGGFFGGGKVAGAPQQVYAGFQLGF